MSRARWSALACIAAAIVATSNLALAADLAPASPDTTLPPLSGPPIDVPMHVPQPPRDVEAPPRAQSAPARQVRAAPAPVPPPSAPARPSPQHARPQPVVTAQAPGGTITPLVPPCRETAYRVIIDGRPEIAIARICRMADGRWRLSP